MEGRAGKGIGGQHFRDNNFDFRRRSEPKVEDATVVKSEEMDEDEIEEEEENMKPFCCNICARGFHCKFFKGSLTEISTRIYGAYPNIVQLKKN